MHLLSSRPRRVGREACGAVVERLVTDVAKVAIVVGGQPAPITGAASDAVPTTTTASRTGSPNDPRFRSTRRHEEWDGTKELRCTGGIAPISVQLEQRSQQWRRALDRRWQLERPVSIVEPMGQEAIARPTCLLPLIRHGQSRAL
eukprot:182765-Prymnesium_polylepis.1